MDLFYADILSFLDDLKSNNNREWFNENRDRYQKVRDNFLLIVEHLIASLSSFDNTLVSVEAKDCVFRIFRDVRFSHDKSPYKTNMGAYISKGGRKGVHAGYYFHLEPNASFISGGIYHAPTSVLRNVREDIDYYSHDFLAIVENPSFAKTFPTLGDDKLKRIPTGFSAESPVSEYLKLKSITPMHALSDERVMSNNFLDYAVPIYRQMQPLIAFINRAIDAE
jgi:uncharacterized protein (TIGR02453 family)